MVNSKLDMVARTGPLDRTIDELLSQHDNPLSFAVLYGSGSNDCDILAVYQATPPRAEIIVGKLDMLALGRTELDYLIRRLDPYVTEPLLTGTTIAGADTLFLSERSSLCEIAPDWPAVRHSLCRSQMAYGNALACIQHNQGNPAVFRARSFWCNLSWALSFREFAGYYAFRIGMKGAVVQLADVVAGMSPSTRRLWDHINEGKHSKATNGMETALRMFERVLLQLPRPCISARNANERDNG